MVHQPRDRRAWRRLAITLALAGACSSSSPRERDIDMQTRRSSEGTNAEPSECPTEAIRVERAPDVRPELDDAGFWLAKLDGEARAKALLGPAERALLAERVAAVAGGWRDPLDPRLADPSHVSAELDDRLGWLRGRVAAGKYVEGEPGALDQAAERIAAALPVPEADALRLVVSESQLWCVPTRGGLYAPPIDRDFDRNFCSSLHLGELVRVIRTSESGWVYVDSGNSVGWLYEPALSPPLTPERARQHRGGQQVVLLADHPVRERGVTLRAGSHFPRLDDQAEGEAWTIEIPTATGFDTLVVDPSTAPAQLAPLELTRERLFEQAFTLLDQPYGWGGRAGERDCSQYLLDLFAEFDVCMPRNSAVQAQVGTSIVELGGLSDADKLTEIRAAAQRGVVLLYMPGHILLYLGRDFAPDGRELDYGISSLSDYLVPCPGGADTVYRIDRVAVTSLELGRGSERRAFIERIERMAIFGPSTAL